jgi:PsbP-like protein
MKNRTKKGLIAVMAIAGVSATLVGCSSEETTKKTTTPEKEESKKLTSYTSENYGVQFKYPSEWIENENAIVQYGIPGYFNISQADQADFFYIVNMSFGEKYEFTPENVKKSLIDGGASGEIEFIQEPTEFTVDGKTGHEFTVKMGDIYMYQGSIEQTDTRTIAFNHRSLSDKYIDDVKNVVRSAVLLDRGTGEEEESFDSASSEETTTVEDSTVINSSTMSEEDAKELERVDKALAEQAESMFGN